MVANPERRAEITDAALEVLGANGSRGLTHRAVDRSAGVPLGTTVNYFPSRAGLLLAMAHRIFDRLAPEPDRVAELASLPPERATVEYAAYATERLLANSALALALVELRLEATRHPEVRRALEPFLRQGFSDDVSFHVDQGLPGGRPAVLVTHHLVMGVVLDVLTVPLDSRQSPVDEVRQSVAALFT